MIKPTEFHSILMVEDNKDDYEATMRSFKKAHLYNPVHWCVNGKDAIDFLHREGKYETSTAPKPALVLMDLNMPGLDGRKALEIIKQNPDLRKIPVVILTTSSDEQDIERCYALGASTYIQKPVSFDGLLEAVTRIKDYWFGIALFPGVS